MLLSWQPIQFELAFRLAYRKLYRWSLPVVSGHGEIAESADRLDPEMLWAGANHESARGLLLRGVPVDGHLPRYRRIGRFIRYVLKQYEHSYIDMGVSFAEYQRKFSSKTLSTFRRKVQKLASHCGSTPVLRSYAAPAEMAEFHKLARVVSAQSYQERLFDAGLPDDEDFCAELERMAAADNVRAFILFCDRRPVSYLYCPVREGVLIYEHLGYDPDFRQLSVGTVLQWLALERLFAEERFRAFDFTEGQGDHKRLFSTHSRQCANVLFLRRSVCASCMLRLHEASEFLTEGLGRAFERLGLKSRIRAALRFGIGRATADASKPPAAGR